MRRILVFTAALAIAFLVTGNRSATAHHLNIVAENIPPYAYFEDGEPSGCMVEIVAEILRRNGRDPHSVRLLPWARGYDDLLNKKNRVLFPVPETEAIRSRLWLIGPLAEIEPMFFRNAQGKVTINNLDDAKRVERISVTRDHSAHLRLSGLGFRNLDLSNGHFSDFAKLAVGRVSLAVMDHRFFNEFLRRHRLLKPDMFSPTGVTLGTDSLYIAMSPDVPREVVQRWQSTLDEMKQDGTYKRIMEKFM
ncbi:substrate-binding periplasmic protein [Desulfovibrio oxyclinae]|uniref:substrate-binding periplasmic protein n=1 Tax=Desulfovibrio oxyclinae TaxID=63560 RepID=UPI00146136AA|nr:transporter substrate-binding domain-containing protein [Desulfovibrio oxyclinae]